jgi:two-component system NtrC family sensor kinase
MPGMNGASFLRAVSERWPDTVRILLSGYADLAAVVEAINSGNIYRFIAKPWNDDELRMSVANAVERYRLYRQNELLTRQLRKTNEELQQLNFILQERITDEVATLRAVNENLMQSHEILGALPAAVVRLDLDGFITYYNNTMGELFSWRNDSGLYATRSAVFGQELNELIDKVMKAGRSAMRTRIKDRELLVRGQQGAEFRDAPGIVLTFDDCRDGLEGKA